MAFLFIICLFLFLFFSPLVRCTVFVERSSCPERERERRTPLSVLTALLFSFFLFIYLWYNYGLFFFAYTNVHEFVYECYYCLLFFFLQPTDSLFRVPCPQHRNQRSQSSWIMDCLFLFFFLLQCLLSWCPTVCCCISLSPSFESSVPLSLAFFFCVPFSLLANDLLRQ